MRDYVTRANNSLWALAIVAVLSCATWSQENIEALAERSHLEAVNELLTMPRDQREKLVKYLLRRDNVKCRRVAVQVAEQTFALRLFTDLQQAMRVERDRRLRERIAKLLETLTLYEMIAVKDLGDALPSTRTVAKYKRRLEPAKIFRPLTVQVRVAKTDGSPAAGCSVQAYSDDYGVCVPYGKLQEVDSAASSRLELFPGKWSFFAAGGSGGSGIYVCDVGVDLTRDKTVVLKPSRHATIKFSTRNRTPFNVDDVRVIDSAFSGFLEPVSLGPSSGGRLVVFINGNRPRDIVAVKQPVDGIAAVLHEEKQTLRLDVTMSAEKSQCARLLFESHKDEPGLKEVEISIRLPCFPKRGVAIKGQLPLELYITPGRVDLSYAYVTGKDYWLDFAGMGYEMRKGSLQKFVLGGPYDCSVFHQFYKDFARRPNVLAYYLFVRDQNNHYLRDCRKIIGRRREHVTIPITVLRSGRAIFDTSRTKPDRQFMSEAGTIPSASDLDTLEYKIELPFAPGKKYVVKGHESDFEKSSKHFHFVAPRELAHNADNWLEGAEAIYKIFSEMLGHTPKWRTGKSGILFRVKMPPGVGAFAGGKGVHFTVNAGMSVTQRGRIFHVPFSHELLHKFGHSHRDFMNITCQEAQVRFYDNAPAARLKSNRASQEEISTCLRGESTPKPDTVIPYVLLARYGYELFKGYFERGRSQRDTMQAQGLSENEGDCAIFADLTDGKALSIYQAAGVVIDNSNIEKGLAILNKGKRTIEVTGGSAESRVANKAVGEAEKAFERKDNAGALRHIDSAAKQVDGIGNHRMRTWLYCRMAELLFKNDMKKQAYDMLKDCQKAAAEVDNNYLNKIRRECLNVLKGEPILRIHFF